MAGSDAITDEKQDEELPKRLLRERRNGVHSEQRTNKRNTIMGINAELASVLRTNLSKRGQVYVGMTNHG